MCCPSTSASVIIMTLSYRKFLIFSSSLLPMSMPMAEMRLQISSFFSRLSSRAFSTLSGLPRSGRMAWNLRLRPDSAEPPAESPSTRNNSDASGSRSVQSNSLPGRPPPDRMLLRSFSAFLALAAASRASAASITFLMIRCASLGFSSRYFDNCSLTTLVTIPSTSALSNRILFCDSNCGSGC